MPVTAYDVKFTLELMSHPDILYIPPGAIESVTVLDDTTITVRGKGWPSPGDDEELWWTVFFPKHLLESLDPSKFYEWKFWKRPVGNGPYRFLRYVPEIGMAFEANPDYFRGKPKIERVVLKFVGGAGLPELLSGNVDVIAFANPTHIPWLAKDPRFRLYYQNWAEECAVIYWKNNHPLLGDARVRLALTLAINRRELLQTLNLPEELPLFDGIYTSRQFRRGQLPEQLPYDPTRAKQLLTTAGWHDNNGDGVLDRDGQAFRFTALVNQTWGEYERIAVYIQDQFRRVGVHMEIQTMNTGVLMKRLENGEFNAAFTGMRYSLFLHWLSNRWQLGYKNAKVVELIHRLSLTSDPDAVDNIYQRLSEIFRKDMPVTFLYPSVGFYFVHRRLQGLSSPWRADPVGNMEELWIEEEK
jgi:peptide/nickel transport system substrate-binding protein